MEKTLSNVITEIELTTMLESGEFERETVKSPYELIRLRERNGILHIIYQDNKKLRSKNEWIERRAIFLLKQKLDIPVVRLNCKYQMNGVETEVDGVFNTTAIEVKKAKITQKWIDFYAMKCIKLQFRSLIVIATAFSNDLCIPETIICYQYSPDISSLRNFYSSYSIPELFVRLVGKRHVRYLLDNGSWMPQGRRYNQTAKSTVSEKIRKDIKRVFRRAIPVKIYWSLSMMTGPLDEFKGRGYPIDRLILAFDIDGNHEGYHELREEPYCHLCRKSADIKLKKVKELLDSKSIEYEVYQSGSKGYHLYLLEEGKVKEDGVEMMEQMTTYLLPYVDSFLSKTTEEFDMHRIFKLPGTVDASTGIVVAKEKQQIRLKDSIVKL
ncbi:MAG: hypothetical protein INQ03_10860 [Candidatus Heimdallarchaeota archaeon]|nr:hypothetical protein [Candidatus Heimdallarchaeota archaeon]